MTDMIDLSSAQIRNSPDVHAWPATTAITRLELRPSGVHIEFTKKQGADRWPDFPFGDPSEHGTLQYTLWIVLQVAGLWYAAGCIEFWFGLDESGGPVDEYAKNWYYDATRWAPMTGHQPAPGEMVGFFVTSGDARHGDDGIGLHERSNIVAVAFPSAAGGVFTFDAAAPPSTPAPVPQPPAPPTPAPTPAPPGPDEGDVAFRQQLNVFFGDVEHLVGAIEELANGVSELNRRMDGLQMNGVRLHL